MQRGQMALIDGIQDVLPLVAGDIAIGGKTGVFSAMDVARLLVARGYLSDRWGGRPSRMQLNLVRSILIRNARMFNLEVHKIGTTVYFRPTVREDDSPLL